MLEMSEEKDAQMLWETKAARKAIPIPPYAEQHRIVAKVDALMALCDRLEAALTTTNTTRARLLAGRGMNSLFYDPEIRYSSRDFPKGLVKRIGNLRTTWDELLWAAITIGRPNTS